MASRTASVWVLAIAAAAALGGMLTFLDLPYAAAQPIAGRSSASGTALSRLDQIGPALHACWVPPAGSVGSHITLRFGLTAQGRLKGMPLATHSLLTGDDATQRAFVAAALTALDRCTPLSMTPELARIVGSRVLTLRFSAEPRPRSVDI